ncbi:MAG TPA: aminopeptidase [Ktedonosporobacter sp.]|nr:aminopeptidase [Ktedonosporobacter sp.]
MPDPRHVQLAKVLVHYSLNLKAGDRVLVQSPDLAAPLVREVYREAVRVGAHIATDIRLDGLSEIFLREASDEQLEYVSDLEKAKVDFYTARLAIWADTNTQALSNVDPKKMARRQAAQRELFKRMLAKDASGESRWCGTLFPTQAHAQDAGMSLTDYEDFVYGAGLLNETDPIAAWRKVNAEQQKIADFLELHDEIHIVAPDTNIRYHAAGRKWISCAGTANFPDGEVFTGPIEDSVNGTVSFSYPGLYGGNMVEGIRLTFRDGKVVDASATRNEEFLFAMLDMDAGSRTLGEAAFGLNYNIQQFSKNTLFDEKIGGTMHMALGASIPESGGTNESGLHWDIVNSLREGKVYADGKLCYEGGKFLL